MTMRQFTISLTAIFAVTLFSGCDKDDTGLLLPLTTAAAVSSAGGNQGVPSSGTDNDPQGNSNNQTVQDVVDAQPNEQDGTSTSPNVVIENGVIIGYLDEGKLTTGEGTQVVVVTDGALVGSIQVVNVTNGNAPVSGTIQIIGDDVIFIPDAPLNQQDVYAVIITMPDGSTVVINLYLAVDNTCNANSLFASVNVLTDSSTPTIASQVKTDGNGDKKFLLGWDFAAGNFTMKLENKTAGAKYVLTAFGVYDISGHSCEVYYQRWSGTGAPVQNVDISGMGTISVDPTDSSLPKPGGGFYSFAKTYVQLKVYNSSGADITETDTATVKITKTAATAAAMKAGNGTALAALSGSPKFMPQQNSLLAYIGRSKANVRLVAGILLVSGIGLGLIFFMRRRSKAAS